MLNDRANVSHDAKCNTPADLLSGWIIVLAVVEMINYHGVQGHKAVSVLKSLFVKSRSDATCLAHSIARVRAILNTNASQVTGTTADSHRSVLLVTSGAGGTLAWRKCLGR